MSNVAIVILDGDVPPQNARIEAAREVQADLHIHSNVSDSSRSYSEIIDAAVSKGLKAISITDHNIVGDVKAIEEACSRQGIEHLIGLEFSCMMIQEKIDVLCYGFDPKHKALHDYIGRFNSRKKDHIMEVVKLLQEAGYNVDADYIANLNKVTWNSNSVMNALVRCRAAPDFGTAKKIYQNYDSPYSQRMNPIQAVELIHEIRGLAFFAHPFYYVKDVKFNEVILPQLVSAGLDGIEAYYTSHSRQEVSTCLNWADKHNLLVSGGSDDHGNRKQGFEIGGAGLTYLEYMKIKEAVAKNR